MIQNPFSGEAQVDLKAAAYSIDMLAILQEKTEGNLEENDCAYLGQLIAQLREAFLKVSAGEGSAAPAGESPAEPAPEEDTAGGNTLAAPARMRALVALVVRLRGGGSRSRCTEAPGLGLDKSFPY